MTVDDSARQRRGHNFAAIYERLRAAILQGDLKPGEVTTQMALADRLSAGRTPLREALRVLQKEGLVVNEPNRRVQISPLTVVDMEELYIARVLLESTAVRDTVAAFTSRDDAEMQGYLAQMDHYGEGFDWAGLREPHRAFHARLYSAGGRRIAGLADELADHAERYRLGESPRRENWEHRQVEHRAIVAAAAARDGELAAQLVVEHYARTAEMIRAALEPGAQLPRLSATLSRTAPGSEQLVSPANCTIPESNGPDSRSGPIAPA